MKKKTAIQAKTNTNIFQQLPKFEQEHFKVPS